MPLQQPRPRTLLGRLADARDARRRDRDLRRRDRDLRRRDRDLRRELAGYDTPSARRELDAVLARHRDEEADPIRAILRAQDAARLVRGGSAG